MNTVKEPDNIAPHGVGSSDKAPLELTHVGCCICEDDDGEPVAVGEDFEYGTSPDSFIVMRCRGCGLFYLNPRPHVNELSRIYPPTYHAFNFSCERFGFVYMVRRRLEARRLMSWCRDLPKEARILDVGCGDGFHLVLLHEYGGPQWRLEGVDMSAAAVAQAVANRVTVHEGSVETLDLDRDAYDLILLIQTIEHLENPAETLAAIRSLLRPGGAVVVVTDNSDSLDARLFRGRYWGGYHFPRHWNLFTRSTLSALAAKVDLKVDRITTQVSPVNWVYSIRNLLVDWGAPRWLYNRFSLQAPVTLALFTVVDRIMHLFGRGALLCAILQRPQ
jgi:2-polyprenyl-3-methyl-5-hydroxy-6-metoxy-1,4-benzoquinol methylase